MAHPELVRAAKCIEQARALNDEFPEKSQMPAEVQRRIDKLLDEASAARKAWEREQRLTDHDSFLNQPEYSRDMSAGTVGESKTYIPAGTDREYRTDKEVVDARRKAFFSYLRKGFVPSEMKADLVEDTNGELLVPADYAGTITTSLPNFAVIRNIAFVRPTSSSKAELGVVTVNQAGWGKLETGDTAADGLGGAPTKETVKVWDLQALVKIGEDELEDSDADLEATINNALLPVIAEQEDEAFASGTGDTDKMPEGVVNGGVTQNVTAGTAGTVTANDLKSLPYAVPQKARANGVFVGSTSAEKAAALLVDGDGRYLFQPNAAIGEPPTLFGYRWYTNDGLPEVGGGVTPAVAAKSVVFGDWRLGYMIADRRSMTVTRLNELYRPNGKIGFLFKLRVGGGVIRPNAFAYYAV